MEGRHSRPLTFEQLMTVTPVIRVILDLQCVSALLHHLPPDLLASSGLEAARASCQVQSAGSLCTTSV
ncbi:hypothetical protein E2C01_086216 [Portunus trituberculatus]|uniref:Uncharacterized protein n=1 Tax=Portunus trituberculatus TaxID=210409 RepID=A0A5B7JCU8_PORTR|nr:hypothetical protein [Portunus trituberculatus]